MRILALIPGGIDAQINFFPTLETLQSTYPNAKIDVLVEPRAKKAYRVCKYVNDVLLFDYQDRNSMADYLNLLGIIRDREYEAALSFGTPWTVSSLLWLNGIPIRIGDRSRNPWLFSKTIPLQKDQYAAEMYHSSLAGLDIQANCPQVKINVPQEDIAWVESRQKGLGIRDGYILLHSTDESYPAKNWKSIITDIQAKQSEIPIVLLQDQQNGEWVTQMLESHPQLKVSAPSDVGKSAAIIAGANLFLSTDSVSISLAVAVGTYTIALFNSTSDSKKMLPPVSEKYVNIPSSTGKIADIAPNTVLEKLWS
ncbi:ADP-heptose:LPS heptosyltransferase [Xenococcus sp. PCC 7305]|uniref:glycosyltransferase family 9 protein n=1 Tax=Xenococcus sp. PCC 7305 TaxID=102125 RepID=UPI0002ACD4F1|nr:glycosyltransferase family 9 protein [Xenococcus sp. PCC 7305]ELS01649.1 ADP-heptose:LPS heptosyltransferase [Xenococcus sp. PCC 7305]